jgi:hypothetical protein
MADLFLSWGGDELDAVTKLQRDIEAIGFTVWQYREGARCGNSIHDNVAKAIGAAQVSLFCFSDETAERKWIDDEVKIAYGRYKGDTNRMIPVWIGSHPRKLMPPYVRELDLIVDDLYGNNEINLASFKRRLTELLKVDPPVEIPAALFAMDNTQSEALFGAVQNTDVDWDPLKASCRTLGMDASPHLSAEWRNRYKATRNDFAPYGDDQSLIGLVRDAESSANVVRVRNGKPPLSVRWIHHDLTSRGTQEYENARDWWQETQPLLIIDSISMMHPKVALEIGDLPDFGNAALIWVPPFTRKTACIEEPIRESVKMVGRIGDQFRKWTRFADRPAVFDNATALSMRLWLQRVLYEANLTEEPRTNTVVSINRAKPSTTSITAVIAAGAANAT